MTVKEVRIGPIDTEENRKKALQKLETAHNELVRAYNILEQKLIDAGVITA